MEMKVVSTVLEQELARQTGTTAEEWESLNGEDSPVNPSELWFDHRTEHLIGHVMVDKHFVTVTIQDYDGITLSETIFNRN